MKYTELDEYKTLELPLSAIYLDPDFNCRSVVTPQSCAELAASMKQHGLQMPILVQPWEGDYEFRIIAGHRRYTAAKYLLKWSTIAATVLTGLTPEAASLLNLVENLERKDLTLIEEARALWKNYSDDVPITHIAKELCKSYLWVMVRWRIRELSQEIQDKVAAGVFGMRDLLKFYRTSPKDQAILATEIEAARSRGVKGRTLLASRRSSRSRREIVTMLTKLNMAGVFPHPYDALSWAAGFLTDDQLWHETCTEE
ncbi:MAG: hypothetical protein AMS22_12690 [Thiotrichales bacterium SG8_50]|nr:MAG: hypothetical protein AMS22_12690 [Thiotrichales bacterium SG8_50]